MASLNAKDVIDFSKMQRQCELVHKDISRWLRIPVVSLQYRPRGGSLLEGKLV